MSYAKVVHKVAKLDQFGNGSALCFAKPHAIDLKRESGVLYWESGVTCRKCIALRRVEEPARGAEMKASEREALRKRVIHRLDYKHGGGFWTREQIVEVVAREVARERRRARREEKACHDCGTELILGPPLCCECEDRRGQHGRRKFSTWVWVQT